MTSSALLSLRVSGPFACFTRPELKVERVSYPVITPSAARGVLEAVLWKPALRWQVERIRVLAPIRWVEFRRNEVSHRTLAPSAAIVDQGGAVRCALIEEDRTQRNTLALRDVDYIVEARFHLTDRAWADDNVIKFVEMFRRRVERGQHFHQPYLGCREFTADVAPADHSPPPIDETRDLGWMLYDLDFHTPMRRPIFFEARLEHGILTLPDRRAQTLAVTQDSGP